MMGKGHKPRNHFFLDLPNIPLFQHSIIPWGQCRDQGYFRLDDEIQPSMLFKKEGEEDDQEDFDR
jgi:hypothetical protein